MSETWRPVVGYEGMYDVSDQGRVRSWRRRQLAILTAWLTSTGYRAVDLYDGTGGGRHLQVHRLVGEAFIGPPPSDRPVLRHLDGDRLNNVVGNLAYGTVAENNQDTVRHGHHQNSRKTHCALGHAYDEANTLVDRQGHRDCRTCARSRKLAWKARQSARAVA